MKLHAIRSSSAPTVFFSYLCIYIPGETRESDVSTGGGGQKFVEVDEQKVRCDSCRGFVPVVVDRQAHRDHPKRRVNQSAMMVAREGGAEVVGVNRYQSSRCTYLYTATLRIVANRNQSSWSTMILIYDNQPTGHTPKQTQTTMLTVTLRGKPRLMRPHVYVHMSTPKYLHWRRKYITWRPKQAYTIHTFSSTQNTRKKCTDSEVFDGNFFEVDWTPE